ncbi:uncharacterized protein MELLADRAFT_67926 [Melampsora larici-populina 98AG31]|uniref:FAR1 domain-containing protein n=1 Tax=Melampsora larici-populina (strain 98AG31 / pathotype 3-4-7) TaxID=747676 RepID=F4S4Y8_MELLP|nr:uncharacterized protein MELLADRAFT_67926 [Melampsora larici-populina 98AG31]EGG00299.1 hypothetical protein MELLADRAFT_67926 [Melampsora larici-populina 98AG31]
MESPETNTPNTDIPAPPPITTLNNVKRESMNQYVKNFATQHGYIISIRNSSIARTSIKYVCHCSGLPRATKQPPKESTSKSLKINCPFQLKAKYNPENQSWTLSHLNTTHNHPPNLNIQPSIEPHVIQPSIELISTISDNPDLKETQLDSTQTQTAHITTHSFIHTFSQRILALSVEQQQLLFVQIDNLLSTTEKLGAIIGTQTQANTDSNSVGMGGLLNTVTQIDKTSNDMLPAEISNTPSLSPSHQATTCVLTACDINSPLMPTNQTPTYGFNPADLKCSPPCKNTATEPNVVSPNAIPHPLTRKRARKAETEAQQDKQTKMPSRLTRSRSKKS